MIDYQRYKDLIDLEVMNEARILCVGVGGASGLCRNLARAGVGKLGLVDPDRITATNPATQAYGMHQTSDFKVDALKSDIAAINPACRVEAYPQRIEELIAQGGIDVRDFDLMLAMTDDFMVQAGLNRIACKTGIDALFAAAYYGAQAVEVSGTFKVAATKGTGCHRCHTYPRYKAYAEGFSPTNNAGSHIFQADYLNAILGNLILSLLHLRAGSALGNPSLAQAFLKSPLMISRLDPAFASGPGEAFADMPPACSSFSGLHWPRDLPTDFVCPDCGMQAPEPHAGELENA